MIFKRIFFRNHPYRFPGNKNLGLPNEVGSFPSVNLFVAATVPFAVMRVHSLDSGKTAKLMLALMAPVVFAKLHLGTSHLSDLLITLAMVAATHAGLACELGLRRGPAERFYPETDPVRRRDKAVPAADPGSTTRSRSSSPATYSATFPSTCSRKCPRFSGRSPAATWRP